jgi:hypothetical protein
LTAKNRFRKTSSEVHSVPIPVFAGFLFWITFRNGYHNTMMHYLADKAQDYDAQENDAEQK